MQCIPGLKTDVQDGLLKELCQVLMNRKLPSKLDPPSAPPIPPCAVPVTNVALTKLALAALGKFDFQRHALQMFIKYIAHVSPSLMFRSDAICAEEFLIVFLVRISVTRGTRWKRKVHLAVCTRIAIRALRCQNLLVPI